MTSSSESQVGRWARSIYTTNLDLVSKQDKINRLQYLLAQIPINNYTLLRTLFGHLLQVTVHSDKNKMTTTNLAIIFSMVLGMPNSVFNIMMTEFDTVFAIDEGTTRKGGNSEVTMRSKKQPSGSQTSSASNFVNRNSRLFYLRYSFPFLTLRDPFIVLQMRLKTLRKMSGNRCFQRRKLVCADMCETLTLFARYG